MEDLIQAGFNSVWTKLVLALLSLGGFLLSISRALTSNQNFIANIALLVIAVFLLTVFLVLTVKIARYVKKRNTSRNEKRLLQVQEIIVAAVKESLTEKKVNLVIEEKAIADEAAHNWLAGRYGLGYELIDVESVIADDGVEIRRRLKVKAYSEITKLDNSLILVPDENSEFQPLPARVRSRSSDRTLAVDPADATTGRILVSISPPLRLGEIVEFDLIEGLKGKFYETSITVNEYQRRNRERDHDFFAWKIDRPTKELQLTVRFREGLKPITYSQRVFYAPVFQTTTLVDQQEESRRVDQPTLSTVRLGEPQLQFKVDYPAVGLVYAIYWSPPIQDSLV